MPEEPKKIGRPRKKPGDPKSPYTLTTMPKNNLPTVIDPSASEPGTNAHYLAFSTAVMNMPAIDIRNPEQVETRINEYFSLCMANDMKPLVSGLALALGTDRRRLWEWASGADPRVKVPKEVTDLVKKAYSNLEVLWESYITNGKINPVSAIFIAKNNFGYRDQQEYVVTPNTSNYQDPATIEAKYRELPDAEG